MAGPHFISFVYVQHQATSKFTAQHSQAKGNQASKSTLIALWFWHMSRELYPPKCFALFFDWNRCRSFIVLKSLLSLILTHVIILFHQEGALYKKNVLKSQHLKPRLGHIVIHVCGTWQPRWRALLSWTQVILACHCRVVKSTGFKLWCLISRVWVWGPVVTFAT